MAHYCKVNTKIIKLVKYINIVVAQFKLNSINCTYVEPFSWFKKKIKIKWK